jgi:hypothetical protein
MAMSPAERLRRDAERRRIVRVEAVCSECHKPFVPTRSDALFCSNKCRQASHRQRVRWAEIEARDAVLKAEGVAGYPRPRDSMLDLVACYANSLAREDVEATAEAIAARVSADLPDWLKPLDAKIALAWLKAERKIG